MGGIPCRLTWSFANHARLACDAVGEFGLVRTYVSHADSPGALLCSCVLCLLCCAIRDCGEPSIGVHLLSSLVPFNTQLHGAKIGSIFFVCACLFAIFNAHVSLITLNISAMHSQLPHQTAFALDVRTCLLTALSVLVPSVFIVWCSCFYFQLFSIVSIFRHGGSLDVVMLLRCAKHF